MAEVVAIPKGEYQDLVRHVRRGIEVCAEVGRLRFLLQGQSDPEALARAIDACADVARLRVELVSLERRLLEVDQELTPVRPPSRQDIQAAFDASIDFAQGKRKPTPLKG